MCVLDNAEDYKIFSEDIHVQNNTIKATDTNYNLYVCELNKDIPYIRVQSATTLYGNDCILADTRSDMLYAGTARDANSQANLVWSYDIPTSTSMYQGQLVSSAAFDILEGFVMKPGNGMLRMVILDICGVMTTFPVRGTQPTSITLRVSVIHAIFNYIKVHFVYREPVTHPDIDVIHGTLQIEPRRQFMNVYRFSRRLHNGANLYIMSYNRGMLHIDTIHRSVCRDFMLDDIPGCDNTNKTERGQSLRVYNTNVIHCSLIYYLR